jgi:hypothetical protein
MSLELLTPVGNEILLGLSLLPQQIIGKKIALHTASSGLPDLQGVRIALVGVNEHRNSFFPQAPYDVNQFRKAFYELFPGNWNIKIADLGNLPNGEKVEDTYYALREITYHLKQMNIIPIFIGGSHDLVYPQYQVFQQLGQLVNIVSVDRSFDFSQEEELISGRSYMSSIIMDKPNVLQNFTNLGYQSFYCAEEEKDLVEKLYFDRVRLGQLLSDITLAEPPMREADIIGFDMKCLSWQASADPLNGQPNGIDARTICALARYAGISDKVSTIGFYELPTTPMMDQLLAQMVWYFIEGVHYRFDEYPVYLKEGFTKYSVALSDQTLVFFKSDKSERWWMELTNESHLHTKSKSSTLLACTQKDYESATRDVLPERWYNAIKRIH